MWPRARSSWACRGGRCAELAKRICWSGGVERRGTSAGADGLIVRTGLAAGHPRGRLGPDDLLATGADADQRDRHADEVGDEPQVVSGGLRQLVLGAAFAE